MFTPLFTPYSYTIDNLQKGVGNTTDFLQGGVQNTVDNVQELLQGVSKTTDFRSHLYTVCLYLASKMNKTRDYGDLRVTMTSSYEFAWDDRGTGSRRDVSMWLPRPQGDLFPLGSHAEPRYGDVNGKRASLLVGPNPNTKPSTPVVARPSDYTLIWTDKGSGGGHDGSFWRPVAPAGYQSLGDVAVLNYNKPSVNLIWCVRADLVGQGRFLATSIWDEAGSGADKDTSCWAITPDIIGIDGAPNIPVSADTFRAQAVHTRPASNVANTLLLPVGKTYNSFDAPMPKVTPDTIPRKGDQYNFKENCKVTLPFHCFFEPTDQASLDNINDPFCTISRSTAWFAEGVWVNDAAGKLTRSQTVRSGISTEQSKAMTHSAGVNVSAEYGVGLASGSVSLNYQFTRNTSSSFTEFSEKHVTETFEVGDHYARVLFTKHVWIKGARSDGSVVMHQLEFVATDELYFTGCALPP
jgi:hypothetical protein